MKRHRRNARTMTLSQLLKRWRSGRATVPQIMRARELQAVNRLNATLSDIGLGRYSI